MTNRLHQTLRRAELDTMGGQYRRGVIDGLLMAYDAVDQYIKRGPLSSERDNELRNGKILATIAINNVLEKLQ